VNDREAATPIRVQLNRKKGWRMPANTVKVDRSTIWGNPFRVGIVTPVGDEPGCTSVAQAVRLFRKMLETRQADIERHHQFFVFTHLRIQTALRGKNLACWCKPGAPCHADVLLEIANSPPCADLQAIANEKEDVHAHSK